jgi:hypothetical protein
MADMSQERVGSFGTGAALGALIRLVVAGSRHMLSSNNACWQSNLDRRDRIRESEETRRQQGVEIKQIISCGEGPLYDWR